MVEWALGQISKLFCIINKKYYFCKNYNTYNYVLDIRTCILFKSCIVA